MSKQVSIIICTANRAEYLRQTLESLAGVTVPAELPTEVIVVDNGSTDGTAALVQGYSLPNMSVRYLYEPRRGQCYARNAGLAASTAEIIVFTDDDLRFAEDWLPNLCQPLLSGKAGAVLGRITLAPHLLRPWMGTDFKLKMASTEHVEADHEFWLVGANMAFLRSVLKKVPQFDVELGPGALGFMDDSLFSRQLRAAGVKHIFAADASVVHHFAPDRLTRASLEMRAVRQGQSEAYVAHHWDHRSPKHIRRHLPRQWLQVLNQRLRARARHPWADGMALREMDRLEQLAFSRQMLIERRRPRHYDKNGLVKREATE